MDMVRWIGGFLSRLGLASKRTAAGDDELCRLYTAVGDFRAGDKLSFYGHYLYRWDPGGHLPPAFVARRDLGAGERVVNNLADSRKSDLEIIWFDGEPGSPASRRRREGVGEPLTIPSGIMAGNPDGPEKEEEKDGEGE